VAHLEILRTSDPSYGSLMPRRERVGAHELPFEPMRRYIALAKELKTPRGAKTTEHLEILRLSCPCLGSLAPQRERPAHHELSYDPARRYSALARTLREPRGSKPFEHLRNLRISDPAYGSLVPKRVDSFDDDELEPSPLDAAVEADEPDDWMRVRSSLLTSSAVNSVARLPRIVSNQAFEMFEDADDELSPMPQGRCDGRERGWAPPPPTLNPAYYSGTLPSRVGLSRAERYSVESDESDERMSNARTSRERSSNDTIVSFLDDSRDVRASTDTTFSFMDEVEDKLPLDDKPPVRDVRAEMRAELKAELGERAPSPRMLGGGKLKMGGGVPPAKGGAGSSAAHTKSHAAAPIPQPSTGNA